MKRCIPSFRSVVLVLSVTLLFACTASAQWLINGFEKTAADSMFKYITTPNGGLLAYHKMTDDAATVKQGAASLKSDWKVYTTEGYGGFNQLLFLEPRGNDSSWFAKKHKWEYPDSTYLSWGNGTHLSLWFNNTVKSTAPKGAVQMRFKIHEAGGNAHYWVNGDDHEDWYFQTAAVYDTTPGWRELIIPLKDMGPGSPTDQGFSLTGWSGVQNNGTLDFDKIVGYSIEWTSTRFDPDTTATGVTFYDNLRLAGLGKKTGYEAIYKFNNYAEDTTNFNPGWSSTALGGLSFFEEKVDTLVSPSALGINWKVNCAFDWGGGANREYILPAGTFFPDMSNKTELQLFVKVIDPQTSTHGKDSNKITMRVILDEYGNGSKEGWFIAAPVRLDSVGKSMGWQQVRMPLVSTGTGWGSLNSKGFASVETQDGILQLNKIGGLRVEFSASRDAGEPYAADLIYSGKILVSMMVPSGFQETDKTPPLPVTGVSVTKGTYVNLVTWTDVPGEVDAKYNAFVSPKTFTTITDPSVENIPLFNVGVGTQLQTHILRAPLTDQNVTLFYGVNAMDKAGNTNQPTVTSAVTNVAKGIPTIFKTPPAGFACDGNVTEWNSLRPIALSVDTPTAFIAPNGVINGDADLFVKSWLAVDNTNLYVAFDVRDDIVTVDTLVGNDYDQDCPDLFIGLYDWRGPRHSGYMRGKTPDYHFRFSQNRIWLDNAPSGKQLIDKPGPNYRWVKKVLTSGYTVEAKIPFATIAAAMGDSLFVPVEGMRIPIDYSINDRDAGSARDGIMTYSQFNTDLSWQDMWRWTYTWIGAKSSPTGVNDAPEVVNEYALMQNYPNPFNPSTQIRYSLAHAGVVTVKVFDILGREVGTLVNESQSAGPHVVTFNSSSIRSGLSSGVYFYRIEAGSFLDVKKMMLLK